MLKLSSILDLYQLFEISAQGTIESYALGSWKHMMYTIVWPIWHFFMRSELAGETLDTEKLHCI